MSVHQVARQRPALYRAAATASVLSLLLIGGCAAKADPVSQPATPVAVCSTDTAPEPQPVPAPSSRPLHGGLRAV